MEYPRERRQTMIDQNYTGDYDLDYDLQRRSDETVAGFFPVPGSQFCIKSLAWRILLLFPLRIQSFVARTLPVENPFWNSWPAYF